MGRAPSAPAPWRAAPSGLSPQAGETCGSTLPTTGDTRPILNVENRGTTGCSDTAFDTTVSTSGSRPAIAAMVNDVDPWQCTTALRSPRRWRRGRGARPRDGRRRPPRQRPGHWVEVDRGPPVQQPHVPARHRASVDEGSRQWRAEQLGPHARTVDDENGAAGGGVSALDVHQGQWPAVERSERHHLGPMVGPSGGLGRCRGAHDGTSLRIVSGGSIRRTSIGASGSSHGSPSASLGDTCHVWHTDGTASGCMTRFPSDRMCMRRNDL